MFHGWRARIHHLSRNHAFLLRTALLIVGGGLLAAWIITLLVPVQLDQAFIDKMISKMTGPDLRLVNDYRLLSAEHEKQPRAVARWLRQALNVINQEAPPEGDELGIWGAFQKDGQLAKMDVKKLMAQHVVGPEQQRLFDDFIAANLADEGPDRQEPANRLAAAAGTEVPPPLANEFHAYLLLRAKAYAEGVDALIREGQFFSDAGAAQRNAVKMAVRHKLTPALQRIAAEQPAWLAASDPLDQYQAGGLLGDLWMQWKGLLRHRLATTPFVLVSLALFAVGVWYVVLVLHADRTHWRWARPIVPLMAGVISVWPTLSLVHFQEVTLGLTEHAPFPHNLWYYMAGVGLREELCKLALFIPFLPWLLWRKESGLAMLTGAFVGFGFALEENIQYYTDAGAQAVLGRLLTANFLHAALTGYAARALYRLVRSRFATAEEFIFALIGVVLIHGGYDFVLAGGLFDPDVAAIGSVAILGFVAYKFFDTLANDVPISRGVVCPSGVLTIGMACLVALVFIYAAATTGGMGAVGAVGESAVGLVPIAMMYLRRLR
ncbi:MAG: PrsW family intramembrane metalloprotease [Verrucomicrobiaceae bacterium]|nr:PrsW family intramembrane metalloprotease [Verrucomicrobiaceae bacterium]